MVDFVKSTIPTPAPVLCLSFSFDLPTSHARRAYERLSDAAALEAVRQACSKTGWHDPTTCDARVVFIDGPSAPSVSFEDAHNDVRDEHMRRFMFTFTGGVRYEFMVIAKERLVMRVFVDLPAIDGVLSTRSGLYAMQLIEGKEPRTELKQSLNPPLQWKFAPHSLNFARMLVTSLVRVIYFHTLWLLGGKRLLEFIESSEEGKPMVINSGYQMYAHCPSRPRTCYRTYAWRNADGNAYRQFVALVAEWAKTIGLNGGYFYLNNFSPRAAPGLTRDASTLFTRPGREMGIFDVPGPPPTTAGLWAKFHKRTIILYAECSHCRYGVRKQLRQAHVLLRCGTYAIRSGLGRSHRGAGRWCDHDKRAVDGVDTRFLGQREHWQWHHGPWRPRGGIEPEAACHR